MNTDQTVMTMFVNIIMIIMITIIKMKMLKIIKKIMIIRMILMMMMRASRFQGDVKLRLHAAIFGGKPSSHDDLFSFHEMIHFCRKMNLNI